MSLPEHVYEAALAVTSPALRAGALLSDKGRRGVRGRDRSLERFREWGERERKPDRPLVWLHAPSVGEALMAKAVIQELRRRLPGVQVAFTHFSPSAERMVAEVGADVWGYVPWDTRRPVRKVLSALKPSVIAFVRTEVWPIVTREAAKSGARMVLVNAVLSEDSGRLTWLGRSFLEAVYRRLHAVGAVSEDHARRYERLGVPYGRIHVTGDARFDQVWARVESRGLASLSRGDADIDEVPAEVRTLWRVLRDPERLTVVAGSTWPADDKVLVPTLTVLRRERPIRLVVAPHEPTQSNLAALERRLDRAELSHARLSALLAAGGGAPLAVVVDRMGILADLYALGDVAYVGGGFGTSGLHSVVEPAALAVPVLFGPQHGNAREAGELADAGGGWIVEGAGDVESRLRDLAADPAKARSAGAAARAYVRSQTGAAERNAELILEQV